MATNFADTLADITKDRKLKLSMPSSNLRPTPRYGTGYGRSEDILRTIPGASDQEAWNILGADARRGQMAPSLRPIAQIGVDSDMPTITGADYQKRNDILAAIRPPPNLDPTNVGRAMRSADPLAELRNVGRAMGQDPRDVLANLRNTEGMTNQAKMRERLRIEDIGIADRRARQAADDILAQIRGTGEANAGVEKVKGDAQMGVEKVRGETQMGVTRQQGRNEIDVEGLRGQNAIRMEGLKGSTEARIEGLRGANAIGLEGVRQQGGGEGYQRGLEEGFKASQYGAASRQQGSSTGGMAFSDPGKAPAATPAGPTPAHIDRLKQLRGNPQAIADFERRFGPGSAAQYLQ